MRPTPPQLVRIASVTLLSLAIAPAVIAQPGGGGPLRPLPPVPVPAENPITEAKRILGKVLFWDEQLSSDNTVACGTCHLPEFGGADPRVARHPGPDGTMGSADDVFGTAGVRRSDANNRYAADPMFGFETQVTSRNAPNFFGAIWSPTQFWDGRSGGRFFDPETGVQRIAARGSLENQAVMPVVSDTEMAHEARNWPEITAKLTGVMPLRLASNLPTDVAAALEGGRDYPSMFQAAFGSPVISATRIAFAIATYERTLVPNQAPIDRFIAGNPNALTPQQQRGLQDFARNQCANCHTGPQFTDNQFHNIGLRPWQEDDGRRSVTGSFDDRGRFKTPSLRNVGLRDRLMHVGWITDVGDALDFYTASLRNTGHTQFTNGQDFRVRQIDINPNERAAIRDLLENALTDPRVANRIFPFDRPTLLSERQSAQPQPFGSDLPGTGGVAPQMIADSPLATQNPDFRVGVHDALANSSAFFLLSWAPSAPGTMFGSTPIHVDLSSANLLMTTSRSTGASGTATVAFPITASPSLLGLNLAGQWLVLDPATPNGLSSTRGTRWTVM